MRSEDELLAVVRQRAAALRSSKRRRWEAVSVAAAVVVGGVGVVRATAPDERVVVGPRTETTTTAPAPTALPLGVPMARLQIPVLDLEVIVVEGVSAAELKRGPGHYPETALPGHPGNAAIAGYRTTYGAPFDRLDELRPGDRIELTTDEGTATYEVRATIVVEPTHASVLRADYWATRGVGAFANALTLTSTEPKYSNAQRLVVGAELVSPPFAGSSAPAPGREPVVLRRHLM